MQCRAHPNGPWSARGRQSAHKTGCGCGSSIRHSQHRLGRRSGMSVARHPAVAEIRSGVMSALKLQPHGPRSSRARAAGMHCPVLENGAAVPTAAEAPAVAPAGAMRRPAIPASGASPQRQPLVMPGVAARAASDSRTGLFARPRQRQRQDRKALFPTRASCHCAAHRLPLFEQPPLVFQYRWWNPRRRPLLCVRVCCLVVDGSQRRVNDSPEARLLTARDRQRAELPSPFPQTGRQKPGRTPGERRGRPRGSLRPCSLHPQP